MEGNEEVSGHLNPWGNFWVGIGARECREVKLFRMSEVKG